MKGIKAESCAQEPLTKDCKAEKSYLLDGGLGSVHESQEVIPGGWKVQKKASIAQYHPDLVKDVKEDKENMRVGWNSQREANNTHWDCGHVEGTIKEREMIPGGRLVRSTPVTPNMILA